MTENDILLDKLISKRKKHIETLLDEEFSGIWRYVKGNYSSEAHFINELLQNADDCEATMVSFIVEENGLQFKHNGKVRFTISDIDKTAEDKKNGRLGHINAITSIGNSSKVDEQKIGKFGIGFKAVFAYTDDPEIYDDNFCFRLKNYIVPERITEDNFERKKGETLFYFPFNNSEKAQEKAYDEIVNKIKNLQNPLLFLKNLTKINWKSLHDKGSFKKLLHTEEKLEKKSDFISQVLNVTSIINNKRLSEKIWLFTRNVFKPESHVAHKISVGFNINADNTINTNVKYDAFCFFPTKEITNLKFLIHAPFLLTDNRQNILAGNEWNKFLIQELAELSVRAILFIKNHSLKIKQNIFGDNFLDLVPYRKSDFTDIDNADKISFLPFLVEIKNLLEAEQILPGKNNTFHKAENAYWAADKELPELFSDEQISFLFDNKNSAFVFADLGQKGVQNTNAELYQYLRNIVTEILSPEKTIRNISKEFTENQSIDWLLKLYSYLNDDKASYLAIAKEFPIILDSNEMAVVPFDKNRKQYNIFLPTQSPTNFPTVHPKLYATEIGKLFFDNLQLTVPDVKADYLNNILPQYENDEISISDDDFINHTKILLEVYTSLNTTDFRLYLPRMKKLKLFQGKQSGNSEELLEIASELYLHSKELDIYFEGNTDIIFLDNEYYLTFLTELDFEQLLEILNEFKINTTPKILISNPYSNEENLKEFGLIRFHDNYYKTIFDKSLDGFDYATENISLEKSNAIWDLLLQMISGDHNIFFNGDRFKGIFKYQKDGRHSERQVSFESTLLKCLRYYCWLYDTNGIQLSSEEITIEDLNISYNVNSESANNLFELLTLQTAVAEPELSNEQQEIYDIGKIIASSGFSEEEVLAALATLKTSSNPDETNGEKSLFSDDIFEDVEPVGKERRKSITNTLKKVSDELFENIKEIAPDKNTILTPKKVENYEDLESNDGNFSPPLDLEEEYNKRVQQVQREIEELALVEQLKTEAITNEKYTYGWFKALMELEYLNGAEFNSSGKEISISFSNAEREDEDNRILVLSKPSRFIPPNLEDIGDLVLNIHEGRNIQQVSIEVVNVQEYTVRAKVKRISDIAKIKFDQITKVVIDIKNPIFLLAELRKGILGFSFEDDYNLKENITENIKFVFGPPGTGKTTFLATDEIIPLMKRNENLKILVLTPTNKSADVLSARIMEKMDDDNSYLDWLIRFGISGDTQVSEELGEDFKKLNINNYDNAVVVSTIARYSYDFFMPDGEFQRTYLKDIFWDYIIVDEASMITLPNIIQVLYTQSNCKFIIAGDPFQISPISRVKEWQEENIYTMVNLNSFSEPITEPHKFEIINRYTQYRSVPTIGNVFSNFAYDGKLLHHRNFSSQKELRIEGLNFKDINVIKFPVTKMESIFRPNSLDGSKYHIYSALFTVEFVLKIAKEIKEKNENFYRIGIICPYRAQADIIEKLVSQQFVNDEKVEINVGTIHGFQGDECDIIFTIFNPPLKISGSSDMFLNKQNILNVAISRARDYLFILMPDDKTPNIGNLKRIKQIADLSFVHGGHRFAEFSSQQIEKTLFHSNTYIYDNSFATTHQLVNIYSKPIKKYEVRCEEKAVDVQIKE